MNEFISMLESFWIVRGENGSDYVRVKHAADNEMKNFINGFLGWKLIINNKLIKLEKIPVEAQPFMGISEFQSTMDYCLLCALLIYLSDIDEGGQFLLSELTDALEKITAETTDIDFNRYSDRKSLVRMLRFSQDMCLLKIAEGSLYNIENDRSKEILYENTGLSVYFSVHHDRDISEYSSYRDFENTETIYTDSEKGYLRTNRVYRRLVLQPAMYWDSSLDPDGIYLKNQRRSISNYLDKYLDGRLDIYNGSAFYMLSEDALFGDVHPSDKMLSGLVLLLCGEIRNKLSEIRGSNENVCRFEKSEFYNLICKCREKYSCGLSKEYKELPDDKLTSAVTEYMVKFKMLEQDNECFILKDGIFKAVGKYPDDLKP